MSKLAKPVSDSEHRVCWLVPDDRGGGVVSVAVSCCRQARLAGENPTLLMMSSPTGHIAEHTDFRLASLNVGADEHHAPAQMVRWLLRHPQDVLFINGCEQADAIIPFVPTSTRSVYVVHDTARRYWQAALRHENQLDAIVAVSGTVADAFRDDLRMPARLRVIHNGTLFPDDTGIHDLRPADIVFLGGVQPLKGAFDVLRLWPKLVRRGFRGRLHWFGQMSSEMAAHVAALPRRENIILYGRVKRSEIFQRAAAARVVLILSRAESFGMATIECMGMGCLPVAWDLPTGTKEIVGDDYEFFAGLGDFGQLVELVLAACQAQPRLCRRLVARTQQQFGESAMWDRYATLICELMGRQPVTRARAGMEPPPYRKPLRLFQLLPKQVRNYIRSVIGRSTRLGYLLRDFRGT